MARVRDLTEVINHHSEYYLSEALQTQWDLWERFENGDNDAQPMRLRRLSHSERIDFEDLALFTSTD